MAIENLQKIYANIVWIGQNVMIMPGVKVGDDAIIAANSTNASMMELGRNDGRVRQLFPSNC